MVRPSVQAFLAAALTFGSCAAYAAVYRASSLSALFELRNPLATWLATLPYVGAVLLVHRQGLSRHFIVLMTYGGAIALRIAIPLDLFEGTTDPYRYIWDGRVLLEGINPYRYEPIATALTYLRDEAIFPLIYAPQMRTVYPPLSQLWFAVAQALTPNSVIGLKVLLLAHELVSIWLLDKLIRGNRTCRGNPLTYAWSPLAIVQLFAGVHLDGFLLPWLLLTVLWSQRRPHWAAFALGMSSLIRPISLLLVPALLYGKRRAVAIQLMVVGFSTITLGWLPFISAGGNALWESLLAYAQLWEFNGLLFPLIKAATGYQRWSRLFCLGSILVCTVLIARQPWPLHRRFVLTFAAYLAFAPTVYPWYLLPAVLLMSIDRLLVSLALPALISCSDMVHIPWRLRGTWQVPSPFPLLQYGGIALVLAWDVRRYWQQCRHSRD